MKNLTIHKQNSIIRGRYKTYEINDMRFLDAIYYKAQINIDDVLINENTLRIKVKELRDLMGLETITNYSSIIASCLKKAKNKFYVEDYTDANDVKHAKTSINIVSKFQKSKKLKNTYEIVLHEDLIYNVQRKKEWTEIPLDIVQKYSTKRAMRLHEELLSIYNLQKTNENFEKKYYLEDFNKIFLSKHIYFSKVKEYITTSLKSIQKEDLEIIAEHNEDYEYMTFELNKKDTSAQKEAIKINQSVKTKNKKDLEIIDSVAEWAKKKNS